MMTDEQLNRVWLGAYILGSIITFGHAYHHVDEQGREFATFVSAVFWPYYWSQRAFAPSPITAEAK